MKIYNKKAPSKFYVLETFEAGIVLTGPEVKAVKTEHVDLTGSYVKIIGSEAYVINAKIIPYQFARLENYDETRSRKLLMHKKEIIALKSKLNQGTLSVIPLSIYESKGLIKLQLGLAKGKKQYEKRQDIKKKDLEREAEIELSEGYDA